ncbi:hypothetical protein D9757_004075 [Collybiopsis confluens]|uniref:Uncharacterized protein n=1 Tax=Collybiopsis confluens TaxID=2823264 RepID=A0A8H5HTW2_9AGAR|nr:hypothetical protein D9757_004075 [Collybiopsis confluens]
MSFSPVIRPAFNSHPMVMCTEYSMIPYPMWKVQIASVSGAGIGSWPASRKFRRSGWLYALQEHLEVSTQPDAFAKYTKDCIKRSVQNREFMEMCIALHSWKINYLAALSAVNAINLTFSGQLANQEGLSLSDLMNTPTYGPFFKRKTKALEHIKRSHYDLLESAITADLVRVKERRARRSSGNRYTATRKIIDMHYDKLRALKLESPLPCLPSFRKLPTPDQLQRSSLPEEEIKKTLQTEPITQLVHSDLANFHLNAKNTLGKVLGFPDWISASNKKLHPVDRLTARFRCRRCQRVEAKYKYFGCLDYAGVIMHMCATTMDKPVPPKPFRATMFEKDTKASSGTLIHQYPMLSILACGIREDEKGSDELLSAVGPRVIGHSHRHQTMSLALLPQDEAKKILGDHALLPGLVSRLTSPGKIATMNRNMKAYLCRHCKQAKPKNSAAGNTSSSSGTTTSEGSAILPTDGTFLRVTTTTTTTVNMTPSAISKQMYTFDALRCHLQDK